MEEKNNILNGFKQPQSKGDWEIAAREELSGANPWDKLTHKGDGWSILPYYDENKKSHGLLPVSENEFLGPRTWFSCPSIIVNDAATANAQALEFLQHGADGVFFRLSEKVDFNTLLADIDWQYCSLNFLANNNQHEHVSSLDHFISEKNLSGKTAHGAFFGTEKNSVLVKSNFFFDGRVVVPDASPVKELAQAITNDSDAYSVTVDTDFFLTIAKLRAMRMIRKKYLAAINKKDTPLFIHALSPAWIREGFQPHGNMLKGTTAAMAAILGGCDVLTIEPEDPTNATMVRAARNISNVLREESFFSKVADPLAGSYFIDDLTEQLADAAWKIIEAKLSR